MKNDTLILSLVLLLLLLVVADNVAALVAVHKLKSKYAQLAANVNRVTSLIGLKL